jgi:transposase
LEIRASIFFTKWRPIEKSRKIENSCLSMPELSPRDRIEIIALHKQGASRRTIVKQLGFSRTAVDRCVKRFEEFGDVDSQRRSGRKRKTPQETDKRMARKAKAPRHGTTRSIADELKQEGRADVSHETVWRRLHERGLQSYCPPVTFAINEQQKLKRLEFANEHIDDDWTRTIFSDEHTFYLHRPISGQHAMQWAHSPDEVKPIISDRYSPSVRMWGGIWYNGKTKLVIYHGDLKAQDYIGILEQGLLPAKRQLQNGQPRPWRFMQDRARPHTADRTRKWLSNHDIPTMHDWPPKGADINPIENIWAILDEHVRKRQGLTKKNMENVIKEEWGLLNQQVLRNTIDRIQDRLELIQKADGASIAQMK